MTTPENLDIDLTGIDVLIIEDDAVSALLISRILSKYGARVETVHDGGLALSRFKQHNFPVVITDINMPGMDGLELAASIKALNQDTKIVATSANSDPDCLLKALKLGFNDYFIKPVEVEKLLWAVKRCCDLISCRRELVAEQDKFQAVVESLGEGILIKDLDNHILYQNRAMTKMFGDRTGSSCYKIFGYEEPCKDCPTVLALRDGQTHSANHSYQINGTTIHIESTASLILNSTGNVTSTVEIVRDITERVKNEQTIRDLAFLDPLTGLSNRRLFEDRLEQVIANSRRYNLQFGLLTLDLDNFKNVNDSYGHEAGDQVLREAADRIRACCKRDLDTISRQGGDEFCIIFNDCGGNAQLANFAELLLKQFEKPFHLDETNQVRVTTSIGISVFPENGFKSKELEIASDRAMYAAKKDGRNTFKFWEPYSEPRAKY